MIIKREKFPHPPFSVLRRIRRGESKGGRGGINSEEGFSLVELIITMAVFVLVIAAASGVFTGLLTQFKQQSKIAETNIEGIVGLEILRQDIEHAGYGLPWNLNGAAYQEAVVEATTPWVDRDFNDGPPDNPARGTDPAGASNPPGGIRSGNGYALNGSDVLVIKAINVATNAAASKWTHLRSGDVKTTWTPACENVNKYPTTSDPNCSTGASTENTVRVIVVSPGSTEANSRLLIVSGAFFTQYNNTAGFAPTDPAETRIIYAVDRDTNLRMPFNRADYYVRRPTTNMPQRCAPNTGILYKATVNHDDGKLTELPLLDCVADIQVDFWLDTDGDGDIDWPPSDNIFALTAQQIRDQVKEVRVYIVAHEGQRDVNYDFSMGGTKEFLSATEVLDTNSRTINFVNLKTQIGNSDYKYYRWKLYTIVVKPTNLR